MCTFIATTLPQRVDLVKAEALYKKHHLGFRPFTNGIVSAQLPEGEILVTTTIGHCDCGTPLGSASQGVERKTADSSAEIAQLRRKGWSLTKIERLFEERQRTLEKSERELATRVEHSTPQVTLWVDFITETLESRTAARIGLYLHFYSHWVDSDPVRFEAFHKVRISQLTPEYLLTLRDDHLYEFVP